MGFASSGTPLGAAVAGPVVGVMVLFFSWKIAFVVMDLIGVVWAVIWWRIARDLPEEDPVISPEEIEQIKAGQIQAAAQTGAPKLPLRYFLQQPTVLLTALALVGSLSVAFFVKPIRVQTKVSMGRAVEQLALSTA